VRVLLDSHTAFWWLLEKARLTAAASATIESANNEVFVSVATAWEIAIKVGAGKWIAAAALLERFEDEMRQSDFRLLPITVAHARAAGLIVSRHRDPLDRLLAAQARIEGIPIVSADPRMRVLGAEVIW
jgi:PIN domain nuclease of toxin-antitoxin system